jgi:hypothetical protein
MNTKLRNRVAVMGIAAAAAGVVLSTAGGSAEAAASPSASASSTSPTAPASGTSAKHPVKIEVFAPERHDVAGIEGKGWFVDMEISFQNQQSLPATGFTGLQLTGPAAHANTAPFPGLFSTGRDDRNPGLVVLTSTTQNNPIAGFSGPGTNLANLFNLTGVTNRTAHETELWDTWIVGAPIAGQDVDTTLTVAEVADLNHDGIFNDAPNVVLDVNHDGRVDAKDIQAMGVASNIVTVPFHINGAGA